MHCDMTQAVLGVIIVIRDLNCGVLCCEAIQYCVLLPMILLFPGDLGDTFLRSVGSVETDHRRYMRTFDIFIAVRPSNLIAGGTVVPLE